MKNKNENLIDYKEAAKFLGLPVDTLYKLVGAKKIPHIRLTERRVRFDKQKLLEWLHERTFESRSNNRHEIGR